MRLSKIVSTNARYRSGIPAIQGVKLAFCQAPACLMRFVVSNNGLVYVVFKFQNMGAMFTLPNCMFTRACRMAPDNFDQYPIPWTGTGTK